MSKTPDSTLADPQQIIADLQRANAELQRRLDERTAERDEYKTETREALEQQTATAEVLQVINSSPGDLAPVFDSMLEKALSLCQAVFGALWTYDGSYLHLAAVRGDLPIPEELIGTGIPTDAKSHDASGRLLRGEPIIHITDILEDHPDASANQLRRILIDAGGRTLLAVPLWKDRVFLGYFAIYRREVRPFADKQIALLQNFAAQAVIAMENARLITETREALEQQTATAEVLGVINSSPGDLQPVFDAMLERATRLCQPAFGSLLTWDGERFQRVAWHGIPPALIEVRNPLRAEGSLGRLVRGEPLVHIADITDDDYYRSGNNPARRALADLAGARTALWLALRKDEELLGAFIIYRTEVRAFSEKEIALLQNFAAQAVIAMENARLITETQEALEQQTATAEVLQVINSSPGDLAPVFDAMLEKARSLCSAAHGSISLFDGERFRAVAINTPSDKFAERLREGAAASDSPFLSTLLDGARLVHIRDLAEIDHPGARTAVELTGAHTVLWVPLRKDGVLLGLICTVRMEIRPFSDKEIALVENFAAQAVIAMENARLIAETREALEQQTATAEVLGVINSSPGDLAPVFDAMLEKALRLCDAAFGFLLIYDGEHFQIVAQRGIPTQYAEYFAAQPPQPGVGGGQQRILGGEAFVHFTDMKDDDAYRSGANPPHRAMVDLGGARTGLVVPLSKDKAVMGTITIYRQEVRPFSDKQIALLQNFAAQAVIAMENARLITETREALAQQTATAEVLGVINSSPGDLAPVFDAILEKAHAVCGAATGSLQIYDGESLRAVATRGLPDRFANLLRERRQSGRISGMRAAFLQGEPYFQISDSSDAVLTGGDPHLATGHEIAGVRTLLHVPLRKDGELLGVIAAGRLEVRPFSDKQIALLQNFAAQAVIAIENARLITETREALEQQTATAEVLQVINSSPGDLAPVFDAILEKAHSLCGAPSGSLQLFDGQHFRAVATRGMPEPFAALLRQGYPPHGSNARLLGGDSFVQVDMAEIAARMPGDRLAQATVEVAGIRTLLRVALRKDGALLGTIIAGRHEVQPFSDKDIALLQNFAAQAVIAMENARLLGELHQRTDEVAELNRGLEARVAEQVDELGRVGRLKRFLAPQLAELIVSQGDEKILESHRREIVVVFCDLRGYTAFTETAEPEEVLEFLRQYHGALGPLVSQFEGTLDQFSGDGIMVFFNDPVPCPDPAERAVKMAVAMREAAGTLIAAWRRRGRMLGFGAGIAQGYATLGQIGFADRSGYTAIGTVCNLAARLCAEAKDGQILVAQRVAVAVEETVPVEEVGELTLKGLTQPVVAYNVPLTATQPTLRVIEGGPQSI